MIGSLYTLIVACIGLATVIEKYRGTAFVGDTIYGAWWFSALWGVLTVVALAYMLKQRLYKRVAVFVLHLAFVVILIGALTTHLTARSGIVRLRTGVPEMTYIDYDRCVHHLPFMLVLKEFRIVNYPGTDAPMDYQSRIGFKIQDSGSKIQNDGDEVTISMNHIGSINGYRLFQQSYDSDGLGITLGLSYDPYGIAITYAGYLLLLIGIIATLFSLHTLMRALYRKAMTMTMLLVSINVSAEENLPSVDADIAHRMGTIHVLYNNRICPLNTVATDFTMKITGSASWHGYSADEVFFSWMIYYDPWERSLCPNLSARGEACDDSEAQKKYTERRAIVEMFYNGQFTKIFPYKLSPSTKKVTPQPLPPAGGAGGGAIWFSPGSQVLPRDIPVKEQFFIKQSMDFLTESIVTGQHERAVEIIAKIKLFQREMAGDVLPSEAKTRTEVFYNTLRSQKWPVFLVLSLSLLLCVVHLMKGAQRNKGTKMVHAVSLLFVLFLFAYVTLHLALRWWLSGHIPVSNGPETMLFMAWAVLLLTIGLTRQAKGKHSPLLGRGAGGEAILSFGALVASFCLLVALLGGKGAEITPLMPVLQSPLLSIHVMTVMCAYALFALQLLLGIYALFLSRKGAQPNCQSAMSSHQLTRLTALSQLLLYPAIFFLSIGIFLGAVWANVSWGNYWSWDPKESWALITLLVYAVPLHQTSLRVFRNPRFYHLYMIIAFLSVVITYFGVNYLLGGMHSYA